MKKRVFALLLILSLALALPAFALGSDDFAHGRLSGVAAAGDGSLLVTDTFNKVVWRVEGERVTRFAGAIGAAGVSGEPTGAYHDDLADKAYFLEPWDVVRFGGGCAVSDAAANVIRYVADGRVYTLAGSGTAGSRDGVGKDASFDRPTGLAVGADGLLYVADAGGGAIRSVAADGTVKTVVTGLEGPTGLCWYGGALYVAETNRSRVLRVANGGAAVFAGASDPAEDAGEYVGGFSDGAAATARFDHPQGVAAGEDGTIYVADTGNGAIRAIRGGRVFTLARPSSSALMPVAPRGLCELGDALYAADQVAGNLFKTVYAQKTYSDVPATAWFAEAVAAATRDGIATGTDETHFSPDAAMNRAMFVTMLSRVHLLSDGAAIIDGDASFADVAADAWYAPAVRWAADNGVAGGDADGFAPLRGVSREELVTMLYRYAQKQGMSAMFSDGALDGFADAGEVSAWALDAMRWACSHGVVNGDGDGNLTPKAAATRAQALTVLLNFAKAYSL